MKSILGGLSIAGTLLMTAVLCAAPSEARITRIEITKVEPAFEGKQFGAVGTYERVIGRAHGEVDPNLPANAIIQDIDLASRNAGGFVEYVTDVEILRPADRSKSNGILFFNVVNRGNKGGLLNADIPFVLPQNIADNNALKVAGDGFMMKQGYTLVWFGWQGDILPGNNRMTLTVPVAKNPNGSAVTGIVRGELIVQTPAKTQNLAGGWFTALNHSSYPTVSVDNRTPLVDGFLPSLTVRSKEQDPRVPIANTEWSFGACPAGESVVPGDRQILFPVRL